MAPDKSELAQQIADVLEEGINALSPVFFGSTYTKSHCCKHLIKPLLGENQIDTLPESLPTHAAKSLRERYSRLMSCFDQTGELLNQDLSLKTVVRHVKDLIKELRDIAQEGEQNTTAAKQKAERPGPRIKHSDEKMKQVMISFEKFNDECNEAKQAWNEVAEHHGFVSWAAARQAYYRYRQKTKQVT
ncbi:MAG: hypothetical protein ACYSUD_08465 [Planctomycetota bacterium]